MHVADSALHSRVAAHPFLLGMSPEHLRLLSDCAVHNSFDVDEIMFRAGDPAKGFYLVESGRIAVEGPTQDGRLVTIDIVAAGEPLGWSWMFEPFICEYGGRALEPATAIFIDATCLTTHRAGDLTFGHELFKRMSQVMVRRLSAARAKLVASGAEHRS